MNKKLVQLKFKDKIVVITGSTGGLGSSVTRLFLSEGATTVLLYREAEPYQNLLRSLQQTSTEIFGLRCDVTKEVEVASTFKTIVGKYGTIDILCNLVGGYMKRTPFEDLTKESWENMFTLNLLSCFFCTREALKVMKQKKFGRIINISAKSGLEPSVGVGAYGISKAAVSSLTSVVGEELRSLASSNITINAIAPSILATKENNSSATKQEREGWVSPESVGKFILYLASDDARSLNGQTLSMYGSV